MRVLLKSVLPLALLAVAVAPLWGQNDWPSYGRDPGHTKYSPLTQITPENVSTLTRAWTYNTGDTGQGEWEATPLLVDGIMYLSTGKQRVVALEPETGKLIWEFTPDARVGRTREHRGVSYWPGDENHPPRIVYGTTGGWLISLDAKSGEPIVSFGREGYVDLRIGVGEGHSGSMNITSPPAIYKHLAIVGFELQESPRVGPPGTCRAYDLRTGKNVWTFYGVPQGDEFGSHTWENDTWKDQGGPSLWAPISVDVERGMVFCAWGQPGYAFDGSGRPGINLFASSVTAHDANTGKLLWYFQTTHHDIFDFDLCGAPTLIDVVRSRPLPTGDTLTAKIPAVVVATKLGAVFILDRVTGQPIFGVEQVPVPLSDMRGRPYNASPIGAARGGGPPAGPPGGGGRGRGGVNPGGTLRDPADPNQPPELAWPTQPVPIKPPLLSRNTFTLDDLADLSPESRKYCEDWAKEMTNLGLYTPVLQSKLTVRFPGNIGGANWGGVTYDPGLGYIFVNTYDLGWGSRWEASPGRGPRFVDQNGYPCQKPPWGTLTAINANTADIVWQVTLGSYKELEEKGFPNTGAPNLGAPIVTAGGLLFIAATNDKRFRAFDAKTGKMLWVTDLEATGDATPMTYMGKDGKQYVVITTGGAVHLRESSPYGADDRGDAVAAYALP